MGCNCKWFEVILAIIVFVVGVWPELLGVAISRWVIGIAAIVLFIHAFKCANCNAMAGGNKDMMGMKSQKMPVVAQRKAKKRR